MGRWTSIEASLAAQDIRFNQRMSEGKAMDTFKLPVKGGRPNDDNEFTRAVLLLDNTQERSARIVILDTLVIIGYGKTLKEVKQYKGKYNDFNVVGDITPKALKFLQESMVKENITGNLEVMINEELAKRSKKRGRKPVTSNKGSKKKAEVGSSS